MVDAVAGRLDVYVVDGGIQRGTDAVKALALGASGVLLGRQMLWALACGGAAGAQRGVEMLVDEVATAIAIMGYMSVSDLDRSALLPAPWAHWSDDLTPGRRGAMKDYDDRVTADDRAEITELFARYAWAGDAGRRRGLRRRSSPRTAIFDGVSGYYDGPDELRRLAAEMRGRAALARASSTGSATRSSRATPTAAS